MEIAPGCIFDHVKISPDRQIPEHTQETLEISLVLRGSGKFCAGKAARPFSPGELFLIPSGIPHFWKFREDDTGPSGEVENISMMLGDSFLSKLSDIFPALAEDLRTIRGCRDVTVFSPPQASEMRKILCRMTSESRKKRTGSLLDLVPELAGRVRSPEAGEHLKTDAREDMSGKRMESVLTYISCNYRRKISIEEISRYAGMNRSAFCRFFHRHTGTTFVRYLNDYRINVAKGLIGKHGMPVSEACYASGFNDLSYFCRTFKRLSGYSPSRSGDNSCTTEQGQMPW